MASIHKAAGTKYKVCWREASGRQRSRTCPDLKTARRLEREIERERSLGRDWRPSDGAEAADLTVMCQAFLVDRARVLAAATLEQRHVALTLFLRYLRTVQPRGRLWPDLLSRQHLAGFYDYMRTERRNSVLSAVQRVKMLHGLWRWLGDHDECGDQVGSPRMIDLPDARPELAPNLLQLYHCVPPRPPSCGGASAAKCSNCPALPQGSSLAPLKPG